MVRSIVAAPSILFGFLVISACVDRTDPEASQTTRQVAVDENAEAILVTIDSGGRIWIDGEVVDAEVLRSRIEKLRTAHPEWPLEVRTEISPPPTRVLVAVIDAAQAAGMTTTIEGVSIANVE
jgi:biopolymer transport protein ExbD